MILNGTILVSMFLAMLGMILGLTAVVVWLRQALSTTRSRPSACGQAPDHDHDQGAYLVFLLLLTGFGLRVLAWPVTYLALASAVPHVTGAMCMFGVTRLCPLTINLLQAVRPLLICSLGGWLILRMTRLSRDRRSTGPGENRSPEERPLMLISLVLLIADGALELLAFSSLRPDHPVSCCGSVYDLPDRISSLIPGSLLGAQHAQWLIPLLTGCGIFIAVVSLLAGLAACGGWFGRRGRRSLVLTIRVLIPLLMIVYIGLAIVVSMEVVTPKLTGLPFHHCLYCLLGKTAVGPWMAVALAVGLVTGFWGSLLLAGPAGRPAGVLLLISGCSVLLFLGIAVMAPQQSGHEGELGVCAACEGHLYDTVHLVEVVSEHNASVMCCSIVCALETLESRVGPGEAVFVTVRDEFTGMRLDSGAAFFIELTEDIKGLPPGNRWHVYQYLENAHIMAFELGGNVVSDPFERLEAGTTAHRASETPGS